MLSDYCLVRPLLSVTLVYYGQTVGWIKMKLRMEVGLGHIVLDGTQVPQKGAQPSPQFSAHVCYGQTAGWIKVQLATMIGLSPGDIVLDGDPAPTKKRHSTPTFRLVSIVAKRSPILAAFKLLYMKSMLLRRMVRASIRFWNGRRKTSIFTDA